jgi:glutamyl-Q tRNA(Asp) synthetase
MIVTRFAPSPTGALHLGHAFSAVLAHDRARGRAEGRFLLRIDDIDGARSRSEFVDALIADLDWLGLNVDGVPMLQSRRLARYQAALDALRARGLIYPCFCTRADIAASLAAPHGPAGAAYPGTCRALDAGVAAERMAQRAHCWRIDMARAVAAAGPVDAVMDGAVCALDPLEHGDVVLARKDAPASYHLASSVDDGDFGITDVVRGADLAGATAIHVLLARLLDLSVPRYHHHPLIAGADGKRLAKRDAAASLSALRAAGVDGKRLADDLRGGRLPTGYSFTSA